MKTLTLNVADRGTLTPDGPSRTGHMWYTLTDDAGKTYEFGFSPDAKHPGDPFAPGAVNAHGPDSKYYDPRTTTSVTMQVTDSTFDFMLSFGKKPQAGGFNTYYNGLNNNCIDFVWKALEKGGLNPRKFEGVFWPALNIGDLQRVGDSFNPPGSIFTAYPVPPLPWPGGEFVSIRDGAGGEGRGFGAFRGIGHAAGRTAGGLGHIDPLAFDLDGDGIETTPMTNAANILFDHDADGIRTGTGWLKPDDGWLVMDRDGNGTIDSGRELFGADTIKSNGRLAANGLDALADFDTNGDATIDAKDGVFANLRIWRDLNQDGISQTEELSTLAANNIATISTDWTKARKNIGNGNFQSGTGTFTRPDGTTGVTTNLNLLDNTFYRQFTVPVALTDQAKGLPTLSGSGQVRDLAEAISLSPELGDLVTRYTQQTGRQAQIGMLDDFIAKWAATSSFKTLKEQADALSGKGVKLTYTLAGLTAGTPAYDDFIRKLGVVERFMGFTYGKRGLPKFEALNARSGNYPVVMTAAQIATVTQTYDRFKADIYESLVAETRLRAYSGLLLQDSQDDATFASLENAFRQAIAADAQNGIVDLVEFISAVGETCLARVGWSSTAFLADQVNAVGNLTAFSEELSSWTVSFAGADQHNLAGTARADLLAGTNGADTIKGGDGDDFILARAGADVIDGGKGNDIIDGVTATTSLPIPKAPTPSKAVAATTRSAAAASWKAARATTYWSAMVFLAIPISSIQAMARTR